MPQPSYIYASTLHRRGRRWRGRGRRSVWPAALTWLAVLSALVAVGVALLLG